MEKRSKLKVLGITLAGLGAVMSSQAIAAEIAKKVDVSGLLQVDATHFSGDTGSNFGVTPEQGNVFGDAVHLQRAQIFFKGDLPQDWSYQVGLDLRHIVRNDYPGFEDTWIGYSGYKPVFFALGRVAMPHGLENWGSDSHMTFIERPSVSDAFFPDDGVGLYMEGQTGYFGYEAAVLAPDVDEAHFANTSIVGNRRVYNGDDPGEYGLRIHGSPWHAQGSVLDFSASVYRSHWKNSDIYGRVADYPEISTRNTPNIIASTLRGEGEVRFDTTWDLSANGIWGPFAAWGEYGHKELDGRSGVRTLRMHGYYLSAAYMLTGETRDWDAMSGTMGNTTPNSPCGAWEVALRYSHLDLSSRGSAEFVAPDDLDDSVGQPGRLNDWTVGLNWYATKDVKFQLNYIHSHADYVSAVRAAGQGNRSLNIFGFRGQLAF